MQAFLVKLIKSLLPFLIALCGKLARKYIALLKYTKKAQQNVEIATQYEQAPNPADSSKLP